jgi:hypothetical protein
MSNKNVDKKFNISIKKYNYCKYLTTLVGVCVWCLILCWQPTEELSSIAFVIVMGEGSEGMYVGPGMHISQC